MQGVEAVDDACLGIPEQTLWDPDLVNRGGVPRRRASAEARA